MGGSCGGYMVMAGLTEYPDLFAAGANDTNVPVVEAEQVVENLQARGVPVKSVLRKIPASSSNNGWPGSTLAGIERCQVNALGARHAYRTHH